MEFSILDPYCYCGKPRGVPCANPIPEDYYTNIDSETARWARSRYVDQCMEDEHIEVPYEWSETQSGSAMEFTIDENVRLELKLTMSDNKPFKLAFLPDRALKRDWPASLTEEHIELLKARDWDAFLALFPVTSDMYSIGVFADQIKIPMILHLIVTGPVHERNVHFDANGKIFHVTREGIEADLPCEPSSADWTRVPAPGARHLKTVVVTYSQTTSTAGTQPTSMAFYVAPHSDCSAPARKRSRSPKAPAVGVRRSPRFAPK